jgi:hypothetical protein
VGKFSYAEPTRARSRSCRDFYVRRFPHDRARQHCTKTTSAACYVNTKANAGSDGERARSLHPTHLNRGGPPNPAGECASSCRSRHPLTLGDAHQRGCDAKSRTAIANGRSGSLPVYRLRLRAFQNPTAALDGVAQMSPRRPASRIDPSRGSSCANSSPLLDQFRRAFIVFASSPQDNAAIGPSDRSRSGARMRRRRALDRRGEPRLVIRAA